MHRYRLRHAALHQQIWNDVDKVVMNFIADVAEAKAAKKNFPRSRGLRTYNEWHKWIDFTKPFEERIHEPLVFRKAVEVIDLTDEHL